MPFKASSDQQRKQGHKNVVLFIDGTWNAPGEEDTNVHQLYKVTAEIPGRQCCHYIPGVGSKEKLSKWRNSSALVRDAEIQWPLSKWPFSRLLRRPYRWLRELFGGTSGLGTAFNIKEAYAFLCKNYNARTADQVYIFGFSRGAFAARSLAGFVDAVGLLFKDDLRYVEEAYSIYEGSSNPDKLRAFLNKVRGLKTVGAENAGELPVYFLGVWDSVGALGIPGRMRELPGFRTEHHQLELPKNVTHARHALSLHELRHVFSPLLWNGRSREAQSLQQVWFAGAHADVGGGYKNSERDLSNIALTWMAQQAADKGLQLNTQSFPPQNYGEKQKVHHQIKKWFACCIPTVRQALAEPTSVPAALESFSIHPSALRRLQYSEACDYHFLHPSANWRLTDVDEATFRLYCLLLSQNAGWPPKTCSALELSNGLENDWWKSATLSEFQRAPETIKRYVLSSASEKSSNQTNTLRALLLMSSIGRNEFLAESLLWVFVFVAYLSSNRDRNLANDIVIRDLDGLKVIALLQDREPLYEMSPGAREQDLKLKVVKRLESIDEVFANISPAEQSAGYDQVKSLLENFLSWVLDREIRAATHVFVLNDRLRKRPLPE